MAPDNFPGRRLLVRRDVEGVIVDWNIGRKRRWYEPRHQEGQRARVLDVSVGGARVLAPTDDGIVAGCRLVIGVGGPAGIVRVRWKEWADGHDMSYYGLEFVNLSPALASYLTVLLDHRVPEIVEAEWTQPGPFSTDTMAR